MQHAENKDSNFTYIVSGICPFVIISMEIVSSL